MPKLGCPCGFVHNISSIPDDGWITVRDRDYEELIEAERTLHEISNGKQPPSGDNPRVDEYDTAMGRGVTFRGCLYECPRCGKLLWCKPGSTEFRVFAPTGDTRP